MAVLVDEARWCDSRLVEALEVATMAGYAVPLWVLVAVPPRWTEVRPAWSGRASRAERVELAPLDDDAAAALVRDVLGADYVAESALAPLVAAAGGAPLYLVELARDLRLRGGVRDGSLGGQFVAGDELTSPSALAERLAARARAELTPAMARAAELCAVLGEGVREPELARLFERVGDADALDAGVACEALVRAGLLRRVAERAYAFRIPLVGQAIERGLAPSRRRALHAAAYAALVDEPATTALRQRLARHAAQAGERSVAAATYLELAEGALAACRDPEAERWFTAAVELAEDLDLAEELRVRAGRARARLRLRRLDDALADTLRWRDVAERLGDCRAVAESHLEEATLEDWLWRFEASAAATEHAGEVIAVLGDERLQARLLAARGRVHFRAERVDDAVAAMTEAAERAAVLGDDETRILALVLLGSALVFRGELDAAEARYEELFAACRAAGDVLHEAAAHVNRMTLWLERKAYDRALEDGERGTLLGRQVGNMTLERAALYNLAELLLWSGRADEALEPARRARELEQRFFAEARPDAALLAARVAAACGEADEAVTITDDLAEAVDRLAPMQCVLYDAVRAAVGRAGPEVWDAVCDRAAAERLQDEELEVLALAVDTLAHAETSAARRLLERGQRRAADSPLWRERFAVLGSSPRGD